MSLSQVENVLLTTVLLKVCLYHRLSGGSCAVNLWVSVSERVCTYDYRVSPFRGRAYFARSGDFSVLHRCCKSSDCSHWTALFSLGPCAGHRRVRLAESYSTAVILVALGVRARRTTVTYYTIAAAIQESVSRTCMAAMYMHITASQ